MSRYSEAFGSFLNSKMTGLIFLAFCLPLWSLTAFWTKSPIKLWKPKDLSALREGSHTELLKPCRDSVENYLAAEFPAKEKIYVGEPEFDNKARAWRVAGHLSDDREENYDYTAFLKFNGSEYEVTSCNVEGNELLQDTSKDK